MSASTLALGSSWPSWIGLALSIVTAIAYFIIASPARPPNYQSPPKPVMLVAGAAYLVGGALILLNDPRLLVAGAIVNLLVMAAFIVAAALDRATTDKLSLIGKASQVGLEIVLIWLIVRPN